jgi:hypothetical protein
VSNRDRLGLTPDLTTRHLWRSRRWARGNENFVYSSLWDFKSSFTSRKILRHGTFPLYFPSERKVCCGFLSPLKIHRLGRVLNPQPLGPVASTLTTTPSRRRNQFHKTGKYGLLKNGINLNLKSHTYHVKELLRNCYNKKLIRADCHNFNFVGKAITFSTENGGSMSLREVGIYL